MKRELIEELWLKEVQHPNALPVFHLDHAVGFTKLLLFEAAKIVCIECKLNGPSTPTRDPLNRTHTIVGGSGYTVKAVCRAPVFYLEDEPPATS